MRGTYTIVVTCRSPAYARFGSLGRVRLENGYYLYTGSARGRGPVSLEGRLRRHQKHSKKLRWHVDYLTSRAACEFAAAVYVISTRRLECRINRRIIRELNATPVLSKIGASDCRCKGHLLRLSDRLSETDLVRRLRAVYAEFGLPYSYSAGA
jgi:Uri superfamily endonuclease